MRRSPFARAFWKGRSRTVVLNRHDGDGIGGRFAKFLLYVPDSIGEAGRPIWEESLELIVWNNDQSNIHFSFLQAIPEVNDVADKEVTTCRDLHFNAKAGNEGISISDLFHPIYSTRFLLLPTSACSERI